MSSEMKAGDVLKNGARVLAVKPVKNSEHLSMVLAVWKGHSEFVTWLFNHDFDGCVAGHYFKDISMAASDFEARSD